MMALRKGSNLFQQVSCIYMYIYTCCVASWKYSNMEEFKEMECFNFNLTYTVL